MCGERGLSVEHAVYLSGIKRALKSKDLTYDDVASQLRMTPSGVKKMLNAKDLSFRRLLQICEVLEVAPSELLSLSENTAIREVELTRAQEEALLKNRELLAVYWCFAIEKRDLEEIQRVRGLLPAELKRLLEKLVSLELLTSRKGRYRSVHGGKFRWPDGSKLASALNREWSKLALDRALVAKPGTATLHRFAALKLSPSSCQSLASRLSEIFDEAARLSEREEAGQPRGQLRNLTALVAVVPRGVYDPPEPRSAK